MFLGTKEGIGEDRKESHRAGMGRMEGRATGHSFGGDRHVCFLMPGGDVTGVYAYQSLNVYYSSTKLCPTAERSFTLYPVLAREQLLHTFLPEKWKY